MENPNPKTAITSALSYPYSRRSSGHRLHVVRLPEIVALAAVLTLIFITPTLAYDEPDNFAGIKFGQDVRQQIPECPHKVEFGGRYRVVDERQTKSLSGPCYLDMFIGSARRMYSIYNLGQIGEKFSRVGTSNIDDKLVHVYMAFPSVGATHLLEVFTARYGIPSIQKTENVQSGIGATFTSRNVAWNGKRVSIVFKERDNKIDEGSIQYLTAEWVADQRRREAESVKKGAGGL